MSIKVCGVFGRRNALVLILGLLVSFVIVSQSEAGLSLKTKVAKKKGGSVKGLVTDSQLRPVVGATVYFVDSSLVDTTSKITPKGILASQTDGYDEPLEDIINDPEKVKTLPQAITDQKGAYSVKNLSASATYFPFVVPDVKDVDHLPGGDASRLAVSIKTLLKTKSKSGLHIKMSWTVPSDATYIGTTACYSCHDKSNFKKHAHQLGFQAPEKRTANQDISAHPEVDDQFVKFKESADYTGGTVLFYENYDSTRGSDKWKIFISATGGGRTDVKLYLWKLAGQHKVTMENKRNVSDPVKTYDVKLVYGGELYKQRLLLKIPGRNGLYPFLQFQGFNSGISVGKDTNYDQTRRVYRDYNMDRFFSKGTDGVIGTTDDVLTSPPVDKAFEAACGACHFTGFVARTDPVTGEQLGSAVADVNGAYDTNGDGVPEEINIGCEQCHGAGSKHREEALKGVRSLEKNAITKKSTENYKGKYIVNPDMLNAERASLICGRCHDRIGGQTSLKVDEAALDVNGRLAPVGIGRKEYLANYASPTQRSYAAGSLWPDDIHGKAHRPQYYNWMMSKHARNSTQFVTCTDCHDMHGDSNYKNFVKGDPNNSQTGLCNNCHKTEVSSHVAEKTGSVMKSQGMSCIECHMHRTAQSGAGRPGLLLGQPVGVSSDANIIYWEGDISSHIMDVPDKFSRGVAGVVPGKSMPVPYVNSCGSCHDASKLQYQAP